MGVIVVTGRWVSCVLCPLTSDWCGGSDVVPGRLEWVAIEVWLVLLRFLASNCYLPLRVWVLPQPLSTKSPLAAAPHPAFRPLVFGLPVGSTCYGARCRPPPFRHRSPCIGLKMACETRVLFKELAVLKASVGGMRKACPCPWIL